MDCVRALGVVSPLIELPEDIDAVSADGGNGRPRQCGGGGVIPAKSALNSPTSYSLPVSEPASLSLMDAVEEEPHELIDAVESLLYPRSRGW